ncbi:LexA-binding, inner membrane-associated putative hydrolase [Eubacterium uniforme]|uniref:LexA-binding, inner membrane-associated putative hydrolase n=1 Tax=Eubacterium uniforme TaxID=39495 RepID=A0A1T4VVA3_9FIRM|nr:metal-dependent hydrolase [Eubacterium uniforme]SKA68944.1 LexA-binding, inner membrane-associated putative hydrolase [Eubacterium uniforme]
MTTKTHLLAGMAASLIFPWARTPEGIVFAFAGGALGGVIADMDKFNKDLDDGKKKTGIIMGQIIGWSMFIIAIIHDFMVQGLEYKYFMEMPVWERIMGILMFMIILGFGIKFDSGRHMHTVYMGLLLSMILHSIIPSMYIEFTLGYMTHLLLDWISGETDVRLLLSMGRRGDNAIKLR